MSNMSNNGVRPPIGSPPKNRLSITDSAAFRKANHDAMEAVKASVAKLNAERERFFTEEGKSRPNADARRASHVAGKN